MEVDGSTRSPQSPSPHPSPYHMLGDDELLDYTPDDNTPHGALAPPRHETPPPPQIDVTASPHLTSEPQPNTPAEVLKPLHEYNEDFTPPLEWAHTTITEFAPDGTPQELHYTNGLRVIGNLPTTGHVAPPPPAAPLPFYLHHHSQRSTRYPTKNDNRTTRDATKNKALATQATPMENPRTHPYSHYTSRTTSKSQHPPNSPATNMILTTWSHVLTALFHCSLPPYVLPDCMKWLIRENRQNHGFSLAQRPLLANAAHAVATDPTITPDPESSWDHPAPLPFLQLARPYLGEIGRMAPNCTRYAIEAHEPAIEQWLSVGLYLYPINTIVQKLWTVAYSYAVHILAAYPGNHSHDDHPTAHFNILDDDYDVDDHPFRIHFLHTRHYVPNTHYLTRQHHAAITNTPNDPHITMTLPRLYEKFRNLMRLKGVSWAIVFIIRSHLDATRRRAYTNELLRQQAPSLLTITNPIIHSTSNPFPTPNHTTSQDYTPTNQPPNPTYHLLIQHSRTTYDPPPQHYFLQSLLLSTNLTLHTTPQPTLTHLTPTLLSMPPRPRPLSLRLMGASHASNTNSFGSSHTHASVIPTSTTNAAKRHNAPQYTHNRPHPPHTSPPTTQTQLAALHSTLMHQYHTPTTNRSTTTTFTSDDLPLFNPTHPPPRDATSLATTLDMINNDGTLFGIHDPQCFTLPPSVYWTNASAISTAIYWQGDTRAPYTFQTTNTTPPTTTPSTDESDASMPDLDSVSSTSSTPYLLHTYNNNDTHPIHWTPIQFANIPPPTGWSGALRARGGGPKVDPDHSLCQVCSIYPIAPNCYLDTRQPDEACHPDTIVQSCQLCHDACNPPTHQPLQHTSTHTDLTTSLPAPPTDHKRDLHTSQSSDNHSHTQNFTTCTICYNHYPETLPPSTDPRCPSCISLGYTHLSQLPPSSFNTHTTSPPNCSNCVICHNPFMNRYQGPMPICHTCRLTNYTPPAPAAQAPQPNYPHPPLPPPYNPPHQHLPPPQTQTLTTEDLHHQLAAARNAAANQNYELAALRRLVATRTPNPTHPTHTPSSPGSTTSEAQSAAPHQYYTNLASLPPQYLTNTASFHPDQPPPHHDAHGRQPPLSPSIPMASPHLQLTHATQTTHHTQPPPLPPTSLTSAFANVSHTPPHHNTLHQQPQLLHYAAPQQEQQPHPTHNPQPHFPNQNPHLHNLAPPTIHPQPTPHPPNHQQIADLQHQLHQAQLLLAAQNVLPPTLQPHPQPPPPPTPTPPQPLLTHTASPPTYAHLQHHSTTQPPHSISPSGHNPQPGHLVFTNITQNLLDATAPTPTLDGLQNHLNSTLPANNQPPHPPNSHNPFASSSSTDLTGTSQSAPAHAHAATTQPNNTFPDQPGMVAPIPPPSDRITPSRVLDLAPSSGSPKWFAFPFSRHDGHPAITKGTDWALNTNGRPNHGYAQSFTSYAAALNYILTIFTSIPPAHSLCPNCMLRHLPVPCKSPSYQWHTSISWDTAPACKKCHHQHYWGSPCSMAPPPHLP